MSYRIPHGWHVVHKGKTMRGDMVLAPCLSGRGRRWYRTLVIGLPVENKGGLVYIRREPVPTFSIIGWLRDAYFNLFVK